MEGRPRAREALPHVQPEGIPPPEASVGPLRVVHVHRIAGVGGSERHLLTLLPALAERGIDVTFLGLDTAAPETERFYESLPPEVAVRRLPAARDVDPRLARRIARELRALRPDLVHTHLVHADTYAGAAALALSIPLVSTRHNDDRFRLGAFRYVDRFLARRARRVIVITEALRSFFVERVGLPAERLAVVHYGLDALPPAWGPNPPVVLPSGARVLLVIGRLAPQKGIDVAVEALPAILERHPEAVLVVLGEGRQREGLGWHADRLGVGGAVLLPGRAGDVAAWLERAELLVHPARWEGFGLVVLEAMLVARPVVASRVSSLPEIVLDGETGLLVPPNDPDSLARAVTALLDDPERASALGRAGAARARAEFSVERMAERTLAVYEEALTSSTT